MPVFESGLAQVGAIAADIPPLSMVGLDPTNGALPGKNILQYIA
jgi:hypothetical protein